MFLSEYGIGSLMNVIREWRRFEQAGARPDLEDAAFLRHQAEAFVVDWERLGFGDVYPFAEDLFADSYRLSARQRALGFDCIRSNPRLAGYNLTGMLDNGLSGEGLWTFWREWKPGVFDAVGDGWSPLRWCLFADPMHGYSGREVTVEAVLANEGVLAPGVYTTAFRVLGPAGLTWEQHADVRVDGRLAVPAIRETIRLDGPSGVYTFAANLERGGAPVGGRLRLHLSRKDELPRMTARVRAWGLGPGARTLARFPRRDLRSVRGRRAGRVGETDPRGDATRRGSHTRGVGCPAAADRRGCDGTLPRSRHLPAGGLHDQLAAA